LQAGPLIWFWSDGTHAHIEWDNRTILLDAVPAWEAVLGQYTLPVAAFLEEVRTFDAHFIRRMHDRVAIAQAEWKRPDVALDPGLSGEQVVRSQWLLRCMEGIAQRQETEWGVVFRAIADIESLPTFATGASTTLL
jgi:hypothetical protein